MLSLLGPFAETWVSAAVLMAALPPALNMFEMARQYDTWVAQASGSVLFGTLVSVVTLTAARAHLAGWWGHEATTRFLMRPEFHATAGAPGWQISNPPILSAAPLIASLEIFSEARLARLRAKSIALTGYLEFLLGRLAPAVRIITPREPAERGCQLSLRVAGGRRVFELLRAAGIVCDWREPDSLRVAPVPLYNRFEEVWRFSEHLAQVLGSAA